MDKKGRDLLVVVAHPDDETTLGGTLARYSREGVNITLVCTTNGGGGLAPPGVDAEKLSTIRQDELREACEVLGVTRLEFFEDRESLGFHLTRHNYAAVASRHRYWVTEIIDEIQPEVVVTFGADGVTGHQSHIMVGQLTTEAVRQSSFEPKLYYIAFSAAQVAGMLEWLDGHPSVGRAYAEEVKKNPRLGSQTPVLYSVGNQEISAVIDITNFLPTKREAFRCHRTQGGGGGILEVFGIDTTECFARGSAESPSFDGVKSDLFDRVERK